MKNPLRHWRRSEVMRLAKRGQSQRRIARALGIAPRTVAQLLREQEERKTQGESAIERELGKPRTPRTSKLDRYEEQIQTWFEEYPNLTAVRLQEKLTDLGYDGGYTIVREHLRALRQEQRPKVAFRVVETGPGQQGQFDWSPYELKPGWKVHVWDLVLCWSRGPSFLAYEDTCQSTILECIKQSFERYGGVPLECVTDSMPGVVDRWECNRPLLNVRMVDFAAYYGFALHIAPRGDGAYKGKVERRFRYVEDNLINGRRFHSLAEFREVLCWWQEHHAMQRKHPVTGRPIGEMFNEERPYLQPLPKKPYDTRDVVHRLVDTTGYVRYETNRYRVLDRYIGQLLYLCVGHEQIEAYDRGVKRVAQWERLPDGAGQYHAGNVKETRRGRYDVDLLSAQLGLWGPLAQEFTGKLVEHKRYPGPELLWLLELQLVYSSDDIVRAMEHAQKYGCYEARGVERILKARSAPRRLPEQLAAATRERIRAAMAAHPVLQRSLDSYEVLRTGDPKVARCRSQEEPKSWGFSLAQAEPKDKGQDMEAASDAEQDPADRLAGAGASGPETSA
ncbi:MAG: IS21 family transposase [Caldilineaceae bacterium]|nr:IS21 family transposase [Caldilineaceae bacterium]